MIFHCLPHHELGMYFISSETIFWYEYDLCILTTT